MPNGARNSGRVERVARDAAVASSARSAHPRNEFHNIQTMNMTKSIALSVVPCLFLVVTASAGFHSGDRVVFGQKSLHPNLAIVFGTIVLFASGLGLNLTGTDPANCL